jgi:hypothetical protein
VALDFGWLSLALWCLGRPVGVVLVRLQSRLAVVVRLDGLVRRFPWWVREPCLRHERRFLLVVRAA